MLPRPYNDREAVKPGGPLCDPDLDAYRAFLLRRRDLFRIETERIRTAYGSLRAYAGLHRLLGMHAVRDENGRMFRRFREWMPEAADVWLTTEYERFCRRGKYMFRRIQDPLLPGEGLWELLVPAEDLPHGTYYELRVAPRCGSGTVRRVPAFAVRVVQDATNREQWCARIWDPPSPYVFRWDGNRREAAFPRIYEAHVGMAQPFLGRTEQSVGTYAAFAADVLPRIRAAGYTAVQLMGIPEHPLYKSFGYQVSGYFAPSSRFGDPEEFKALVDEAHRLGLAVILDVPHSHAAPNTEQGIAAYDTGSYFFTDTPNQWGSRSFDYSREPARRFLLSNCRYWLEEYHVDGFRFDAVGNMIYTDHGFGDDFSHVGRCFYTSSGESRINEAGTLYLQLANALIREVKPEALTVAEEFSGMPGMTSPPEQGGLGFGYRFAMGIPDFWGKFIAEGRNVGTMWHELTNRRSYESTISYVECHDQCINGKDAMIWRLIGDDMYTHMGPDGDTWKTSRGTALHKLMRLAVLGTAGQGYLNFMGNEFGHPEWLDAESYGHRQWHLADAPDLKYRGLGLFDRDMLQLVRRFPDAFAATPALARLHDDERMLAFVRGRLVFVLNFHETRPAVSWGVPVHAGKYTELLSSDEIRYAGHGNLTVAKPPLEHFSCPDQENGAFIQLYIPPLTALVLEYCF